MLETLIIVLVASLIVGAWIYCLKNPKKCLDWRSGKERRAIDQPLDYEDRRKAQRRKDNE